MGIPRTRQLVAAFLTFLHDPDSPVHPPILWNDWEAYYHIMQYEGDRTVDVSAPTTNSLLLTAINGSTLEVTIPLSR